MKMWQNIVMFPYFQDLQVRLVWKDFPGRGKIPPTFCHEPWWQDPRPCQRSRGNPYCSFLVSIIEKNMIWTTNFHFRLKQNTKPWRVCWSIRSFWNWSNAPEQHQKDHLVRSWSPRNQPASHPEAVLEIVVGTWVGSRRDLEQSSGRRRRLTDHTRSMGFNQSSLTPNWSRLGWPWVSWVGVPTSSPYNSIWCLFQVE